MKIIRLLRKKTYYLYIRYWDREKRGKRLAYIGPDSAIHDHSVKQIAKVHFHFKDQQSLKTLLKSPVRVGGGKNMVHIDSCPKCHQPGSLHKKSFKCGKPNCKCAKGFSHPPKPIVEHYVSYDSKTKKRHRRFCYIKLKDLAEDERGRIIRRS
jgi:hypothetical protein